MSATAAFIESLREDITNDLEKRLLEKLEPYIEKRLYGNTFDVTQAAKYQGISESTVRRMCVNGEIPFFRQRGQYYFRQSDIDAWVNEQVRNNYPRGESGEVELWTNP
ncbi:helix-turn-helix domain-containing protein [Cohnella nanjingensis]|uniref:Helix-turn-helix domain-containing protein n=1 Tax=Cohnella nanjingensis TaxID=1387779 RepID=A0A7X0RMY8_9BACL|nr:helix-turn-helix domain-containing protein [Cohnella nanjingensis]MBB6670243.1 helix-turn-helix domain-containing protein [Cohnella nanjingensis]